MGEMADLEGDLATAKKLLKDAVTELHDFKRRAEVRKHYAYSTLMD